MYYAQVLKRSQEHSAETWTKQPITGALSFFRQGGMCSLSLYLSLSLSFEAVTRSLSLSALDRSAAEVLKIPIYRCRRWETDPTSGRSKCARNVGGQRSQLVVSCFWPSFLSSQAESSETCTLCLLCLRPALVRLATACGCSLLTIGSCVDKCKTAHECHSHVVHPSLYAFISGVPGPHGSKPMQAEEHQQTLETSSIQTLLKLCCFLTATTCHH